MQNNQTDFLNTIFRLAENIEYEKDAADIVTVLKRQDHKVQRFFRSLKFRIPEYSRQALDEYGSYVFLQIDGAKTVEEIGVLLQAKYGDKVQPLYERLIPFLNHIHVNCRYIEKTKL